jgi:hypothetical protein
MSNRINNVDIKRLVDLLNDRTGNNRLAWSPDKRGANTGTYYVDGAYGGVRLVQIMSDGGGIRTVSHDGYGTKRELYNYLLALLDGIDLANDTQA